jgi:signal transduction histidine kinase
MRTRNWSIRSKIIALVAVPLTALAALWIFATALTAGPAVNLLSARTLLDTVGHPGEVLVGELQKERRLSVVHLSGTAATVPGALADQRAATDRAAAQFRRTAGGDDARDAASDTLRTRIAQVFADLDGLPANRGHIDRREVDVIGAQGLYNGIVNSGFQMFSATASYGDERVDRQIRGLTTIGRGQEHLSRADALLAGANAAGRITPEVRGELLPAIVTSRFLLTEGVADMPAGERATYQRLTTSEAVTRLRAMQETLVTESRAGAPSPVTQDAWQPAYDSAAQQLRAFQINANDAVAERAGPVAVTVLTRLALAGLLGLAALIVSIVVLVRVGRSIVGRLRRLRGEALEMADERLPAVVRRLQRGEVVDVAVETPPLRYGDDEIGQVGHAFNAVQRTAVQSAVEEAGVRRGINEVFLNIARRSQTLLHRQLALLDRMERRETEPEELEDLYRIDHLATRMRRHAEDLVILAGAAPGRGWRNPVPIIDVIRGAISEVEDYRRIDIRGVEPSAVVGRAVGDVIHLLAELLENAASFSPPQTRVQVIGQELPNGYAVEIEDRGLGMSPESVDEANRKLAEPPDFDPADSARLGLFVVAQLAGRHGIRVSLRASAYGGITAVVLVPGELVTAAPGPAALPAGPSAADRSWDRPLVGTGTEDPARRSRAALQWQDGEEVRSITVPGRPVAITGFASTGPSGAGPDHGSTPSFDGRTGMEGRTVPISLRPTAGGAFGVALPRPRTAPDQEADGHRPATAPAPAATGPIAPGPIAPGPTTGPAGPGPGPGAGPAPSTVADGLTAEGLVRRRRPPARRPMAQGSESHPPTIIGTPAIAPPVAPARGAPAPAPGAPAPLAAPARGAPAPAPGAPAPGASAPAGAELTPDGLPRRVRQASLAPQLRNAVPDEPDAPERLRSPEQVRTIMSALQRGTTRGRRAAAGIEPGAGAPGSGGGPGGATGATRAGSDEAATVSLPIVRDTHPPSSSDQAG